MSPGSIRTSGEMERMMSEYLKTLSRYFQFVGMRNDANSPNGVIEEDVTCWVRPVLNELDTLKREIVILKKNTMYFDAEVGKYRCIHCKATLETFGALAHKAGCPLLAQEQE